MSDHVPDRALSLAVRAVGVICVLAFWPLTRLWPGGWAWHTGGDSAYLTMIIGIYATLGVLLVWAGRDPVRHLALVWFTVWSSVVHAAIMTVQALAGGHGTMGHLYGDIPALLLIAAVLGLLARRASTRPTDSDPLRSGVLAQVAPEVRHRERDAAALAGVDEPLLEEGVARG